MTNCLNKWRFYEEDGLQLRECNICKLSQFKTKDGDWAIYFTYERVKQYINSFLDDIEENCAHTPDED